jgi:hypothetical protein
VRVTGRTFKGLSFRELCIANKVPYDITYNYIIRLPEAENTNEAADKAVEVGLRKRDKYLTKSKKADRSLIFNNIHLVDYSIDKGLSYIHLKNLVRKQSRTIEQVMKRYDELDAERTVTNNSMKNVSLHYNKANILYVIIDRALDYISQGYNDEALNVLTKGI